MLYLPRRWVSAGRRVVGDRRLRNGLTAGGGGAARASPRVLWSAVPTPMTLHNEARGILEQVFLEVYSTRRLLNDLVWFHFEIVRDFFFLCYGFLSMVEGWLYEAYLSCSNYAADEPYYVWFQLGVSEFSWCWVVTGFIYKVLLKYRINSWSRFAAAVTEISAEIRRISISADSQWETHAPPDIPSRGRDLHRVYCVRNGSLERRQTGSHLSVCEAKLKNWSEDSQESIYSTTRILQYAIMQIRYFFW